MAMNPDNKEPKKQPVNMTGFGFIIGVGAGVAVGVALENIAVGIGVGAGAGLIFGSALGRLNNKKD